MILNNLKNYKMGKGDKKTKRGKITIGSYGVSRPKKKKATVKPAASKKSSPKAKAEAAPKKAAPRKKASKKE